MAATATGTFSTSYGSELRIARTTGAKVRLGLVLVVLLALPYVIEPFWLTVACQAGIGVIAALGLNILTGFTGQISLATGGFLAVGAYTSTLLSQRAGVPVPLSILAAVAVSAVVGILLSLPALRLRGLYLAIASLAAQEIIIFAVRNWELVTGGNDAISLPRLELFGFVFRNDFHWYWVVLLFASLAVVTAHNLFRTGAGRQFMAVRDQEVAAEAMGIDITRAKVTAFAVSSAYIGLAGALTAHYTETVTWERFTIDVSIAYLAMIIVGGLGSVAGAVYGAAFIMLLPPLLAELADALRASVPILADQLPAVQAATFGLVIVLFLLFEPRGLDRIWRRAKDYVRFWPFRY
jgi:branched-chain amino acid transport system permease protein